MDIVLISIFFILIGLAMILFRKWNMENNIIPYLKNFWKYEPSSRYLEILEYVQIVLGVVGISVGLLVIVVNFTKF